LSRRKSGGSVLKITWDVFFSTNILLAIINKKNDNYLMNSSDENKRKAAELALDVLNYTRDTLMVNLRFLDAALNRLEFVPYTGSMVTDGYKMFYDPRHILSIYRDEKERVFRDLLHLIFHCVFQHICIPSDADLRLWNLACDISAEYTVSELNQQSAKCRREQRQRKVYPELEQKAGMLTAEKIYKYYQKNRPDEERLAFLEETFRADDHSKWARSDEALTEIWSAVSRRMQVDMETFARQQGGRAGAVMLNLKEVNREISDYAGFLRKFSTKGDGMKLDPDEFDYTLYSLGMQMSDGKMPMIEPVEYRDPMRIRDIVLSITVSENTPASKVKMFLRDTWEILRSTETFFSKVRLHVLTEGEVPSHSVITSAEEMDEFACGLKLAASENKDFRGFFNAVTDLKRRGAFRNLRGMVVFSDSEGIFPANMPAFPAAFVFITEDYSTPPVPAWAVRLVLQKDEI